VGSRSRGALRLHASGGSGQVSLNGLDIGLTRHRSIRSASLCATGELPRHRRIRSGLLDMAFPTETFAPMRLASRFSKAQIERKENEVVITWSQLVPAGHASRCRPAPFRPPCGIRADADGRSINLQRAHSERSAAPVPQVRFPDLWASGPSKASRARACGCREKWSAVRGAGGKRPMASLLRVCGVAARVEGIQGGRLLRGENSLFAGSTSAASSPQCVPEEMGHVRLAERDHAPPGIDPRACRMAWSTRNPSRPARAGTAANSGSTPHAGGWAKASRSFAIMCARLPRRACCEHVTEDLAYNHLDESRPRNRIRRKRCSVIPTCRAWRRMRALRHS